MKKYKKYLLLTLLLIPNLILAYQNDSDVPILFILVIEAFVSIHMSVFVLIPLSKIIAPENNKKVFLILLCIRIVILLYFDFFVNPNIFIVDFLSVFIGAFVIVPILAFITKRNPYTKNKNITANIPINNNLINNGQEIKLTCTKCGGVLDVTDKFCTHCGAPFEGNNVSVSVQPKVIVKANSFDPIYYNSEDRLLELFINKELTKAGIDAKSKLMPESVLKRKSILSVIFTILVFVYISLIFFHFPLYTYIIGIIILFVFSRVTKKYDLIKYLKKEIKSRPSEKISNIVMNAKNTLVENNIKSKILAGTVIAMALPLVIFSKPRILYEKVDGGYAMRYYAFGLSNFKTVTIPEKHKGKDVVSLRGNAFSNMPFLEKVTLPDTITEIRGQAFRNDKKLVSVNIPSKLEYLGGGAFYNCKSIENIEFPDTLTYLGGEAFYGATSLKNIKLSNNLLEIRGDTFEYCTSLVSITIPDSVTRIGGHAFYGDVSLSEVKLTSNSKLKEIGSSAFRRCQNLHEITIPRGTSVNERAFKESPTIVYRFD